MANLAHMIRGEAPVCAPLVLDPLMAKLAEQAGFKALYLGGGASGYRKVHLEANLSLTEMCQAGLEIRTVTDLPLILDAAAGWGDPMHMHRTVAMAEAAGFAAIEIERIRSCPSGPTITRASNIWCRRRPWWISWPRRWRRGGIPIP